MKSSGTSRRQFLQATGLAIAAPTIIRSSALGAEGRPAAANRIVIGYRVLDSAPLPRQRWRIIPRSELPVVFQPAGPDSSAPAPAASEAPQVPGGRNSSPPAP